MLNEGRGILWWHLHYLLGCSPFVPRWCWVVGLEIPRVLVVQRSRRSLHQNFDLRWEIFHGFWLVPRLQLHEPLISTSQRLCSGYMSNQQSWHLGQSFRCWAYWQQIRYWLLRSLEYFHMPDHSLWHLWRILNNHHYNRQILNHETANAKIPLKIKGLC